MVPRQEEGKTQGQPPLPTNVLEEEDDCPRLDHFRQLVQSIRPLVFIINVIIINK